MVEPESKKDYEACTKKGLNTYLSVADLPKTKRYSAITMWHVLEHLTSPEKILQELHALMEADALLIVAVPNFNSHDAKILCFRMGGFRRSKTSMAFYTQGLDGFGRATGLCV